MTIPDTSVTNQGYTVTHQRVSFPLTRSSRGAAIMGVVFRALHSGVTLHGLVTPVKAPVCSLGCTARPQPPQKETANASVRAAIAPDQTLLIFPQYLGTGITSQSLSSKRIICAFGCHHRPSLQNVPPEPSSVLRNYTVVSARAFKH
jgi:hypothetical protein